MVRGLRRMPQIDMPPRQDRNQDEESSDPSRRARLRRGSLDCTAVCEFAANKQSNDEIEHGRAPLFKRVIILKSDHGACSPAVFLHIVGVIALGFTTSHTAVFQIKRTR